MATDLVIPCNLSHENDCLHREIEKVFESEKAFLTKVHDQIGTSGNSLGSEWFITYLADRGVGRAFLFPADTQHDHFLIIQRIVVERFGSEVYRDGRAMDELSTLQEQISLIDRSIDEIYRRLDLPAGKSDGAGPSHALRKDFCRMTNEYYDGFRINGSMTEVLLHHCRLARLVAHQMNQLVNSGVLPRGVDTRPIPAFFHKAAIKNLFISRFSDCWPYIGLRHNRYVLIVEKPAICEKEGGYQTLCLTFPHEDVD